MKLPRIYEHFVPGQLVTITEMKEKLERDGNTIRKRLSELISRGYIASVRQGLYVVCNAAQRYEVPALSPFVVGSRLSSQSYIGFRSALQFHAGFLPRQYDVITVVSPTKFNAFTYGHNQFLWCQSTDLHNVQWACDRSHSPNDVRVSTLERTIVDCLKRPFHCNDFDELLSLCLSLKVQPEFMVLLEHVRQSDVSALCNRLGFLLECLAVKWEVPGAVLRALFEQMSKKVSEWNVKVKREGSPKAAVSAVLQPSYSELAALRSRWKLHFPRHFDGRPGPDKSEGPKVANSFDCET